MLKQLWNRGVVKKISLCGTLWQVRDTFWNVISIITQQSYLFNDISTKSVRVEIIFRIYMLNVSTLILGPPQLDAAVLCISEHLWTSKHQTLRKKNNNDNFTVALHLWLMPPWDGAHQSKLHLLRVLLQDFLRKSILIKRSLRWAWSSRSSPDLGLRTIRKLKARRRRSVRNPFLLK